MSAAKKKFICIHGHFYQPPRENPWLEDIEIQESAHPWHDWNQRITEECYAPNTQAKILGAKDRLVKVVNNYEYISFNFGPTLLNWMERHAPETYQAIISADRASVKARSGHGNALAQAHSHIIMPLASTRDKITQIVWGLEDFRKRFGRDPEGMWLPETAVDLETLDILAQHEIKFTILAPRQALRIKEPAATKWTSVEGGAIDPTRPYRCELSQGRSIALFFYYGPISQAIAFEGLLNSGAEFKNRLLAGFSDKRTWPQLMHIATDGESYGHHHRFGEMALAYALDALALEPDVVLTNYGEFLEKNPPDATAEIVERSSWSCTHGVGRWSEDCGCRVDFKPGWNQKWRTPLRNSLNLLRDRVDKVFVEQSSGLLKDPWAARNAYISVLLDRENNPEPFLAQHSKGSLSEQDRIEILELMEMQRNRMLMFTSCGWFFDDILGIETLQILKYAGRVLQLALPFDAKLEEDFLRVLQEAVSNRRPTIRGDEIFLQRIKPQVADLAKVAAHTAMFSVFRDLPIHGRVYCYEIRLNDSARENSGERSLLLRLISVRSNITTRAGEFVTATLHMGGIDLRCSVQEHEDHGSYAALKQELHDCFAAFSTTELIRKMDSRFPGTYFTLEDLFVEQRAEVIEIMTRKMAEEQAGALEAFYRRNKEFAMLIRETEAPLPDTFLACAKFVLNRRLLRELEKLADGFYPDELKSVLEETRRWKIEPDTGSAEKIIRSVVLDLVRKLERNPEDKSVPDEIIRYLDLCRALDIPIRLDQAQILFYRIARRIDAEPGIRLPPRFPELAERLAVRIRNNENA